jgi:hypothetical protein
LSDSTALSASERHDALEDALPDEENYLEVMAGMDAMHKSMAEEAAKDRAVLDQVRALVSPKVFAEIEEELQDADHTHSYLIADAPRGEPQETDYSLGDIYVDQTVNGGFTGDEHAGTVSMPLPDGRYFQFDYVC